MNSINLLFYCTKRKTSNAHERFERVETHKRTHTHMRGGERVVTIASLDSPRWSGDERPLI